MGVEVCVSSIFNFQLSTLKAVSETEARHDVLAVRPDLLAQAGDVDVDRTVEHIYFVFPYPGKDFFAREHVPFVFEEEFQYLEFLFGERDFPPVDRGFDASRVERKGFVFETFAFLHFLLVRCAAQHGFHACHHLADGEGLGYLVVGA